MSAILGAGPEWLEELIAALPPEIVGAILTGGAVLLLQIIRERTSHARYREKMALSFRTRLLEISAIHQNLHGSGSLDRHLNSLEIGDITRFHAFMGSLGRVRLDLRDLREFLVSVRASHELFELFDVIKDLDKLESILISDEAVIKGRIDGQASIILRQISAGDKLNVEWMNTSFFEGMSNERVSDTDTITDLAASIAAHLSMLERLTTSAIVAHEQMHQAERGISLTDLLPDGNRKRWLAGLKPAFAEDHPLNGPLRLCLEPKDQLLLGLEPYRRARR